MLTGADLLAKVQDLGDVSKTDLATQCGYVSKKKDGSDRVNFTAFYEALLNAKGVKLGGSSPVLEWEWAQSQVLEWATATSWWARHIPPCFIWNLALSSKSK